MEADKKVLDTFTVADTAPVLVDENVPPKLSIGKKILYHLWDADQHLKSPEERRLVRKLDFGILICATLGWWMKYIDQNNIVNAYVTGMREDLQMFGNEYTYCLMLYTIAFAIMQIPANIVGLKFRPRYVIVICEMGWTIFTFAQAGATNAQQMYVFRFMVGFFEAGFSPIIVFLIGSWYNRPELAKRIAIWHITGFFGQATSGFLQAGVNATLNGKLGIAGWRWLYIICGCMSLPVAISVWFLLPDYPHNTTAWYITEKEKEIAIQRAANNNRAAVTGKLDLALLKRMAGNWRWWVLVAMYTSYGISCRVFINFPVYLKSAGYSVSQRNLIPSCGYIVTMCTDFLWAFMSDMTQNRYAWIMGPLMCTTVVGASILTAWPNSDALIIAGFFLAACGYVTSVVWTWANEINNSNAEERALTISSMNCIFYAVDSFLPILIFPQTSAPRFPKGFPTTLAFALLTVVLVGLAQALHKRQLRQEAADLPLSERATAQAVQDKVEDNNVTAASKNAILLNQ